VIPIQDCHPLAALLAGRVPFLCFEAEGAVRGDATPPAVLLSGSFNPLHEGHRRLAVAASSMTGLTTAFELSVVNADKPTMAGEEARRRVEQFAGWARLWVTRAPTFVEKAEVFPGCVFVVGADTAERIVHARFYGQSNEKMAEALDRIRTCRCRFLTAGRVNGEGRFLGLEDLAIPADYRDLFIPMPEAVFRLDVSSTSIRIAPRSDSQVGL
jgi:hypothetical protein